MKENEKILKDFENTAKKIISPIIIALLGIWYNSSLVLILGIILIAITFFKDEV